MIDIEVMIIVSYTCSTFSSVQGLAVLFLLEFIVGVSLKLSISERIQSEKRRAVLEVACLKRRFCCVKSNSVPVPSCSKKKFL